jgi:ATP-dependent helicase/nuclease subunit A
VGSRAAAARSARAAAAQQGLPALAAAGVARLAAAVLDSPGCGRFFDAAALHWAGNEVPLAWQGRSLCIDRLVALQDAASAQVTWWVLDYKLQSDPASVLAYRDQMASYVAAVAALQPGDAVRGAFITGQGELVEV